MPWRPSDMFCIFREACRCVLMQVYKYRKCAKTLPVTVYACKNYLLLAIFFLVLGAFAMFLVTVTVSLLL